MTTRPIPGAETIRVGPLQLMQRVADWLALGSAYFAAACLAALTFLVLAEIGVALLSKFIQGVPSGISIAWEYSSYLMGAAFMFGGALTLRAGMQIRVELLLRARRGAWARPIELLSSAIGAGFMIFLAWYMTAFAYDSYVSGQVSADSDTPLWIPQAALALATAIFALQTVVRVFACIAGMKLENEAFKVASAAE